MYKVPVKLTPIDLSKVRHSEKNRNTPEKENFELMYVDHLYQGVVSGPESFVFYGDSIITSCADGKVLMLGPDRENTVIYSRCDKPDTEEVRLLVLSNFRLTVYPSFEFCTSFSRCAGDPWGSKL